MKMAIKNTELKKQDIINEMIWNDKIDASQVEVEVDDGKVELSGTVGSFRERREAELDAWSVLGVRNVENDLKVDLTEGFSYPSDEELKDRVNNTLSWDFAIDSSNIELSVENGWVTIEGTVDSFWKIAYTENEVSKVLGVVGITNKLAAAPKKRVSDDLIAKDIMDAIERKALILPEEIDLMVKDNVVTLNGNVSSWSAWREAYDAAENTLGVINVIDNIKINP